LGEMKGTMISTTHNPKSRMPTSLRLKVAVGVALPVLVILTGLSLLSYWRANSLMEEQIGAGVEELGQVTLGSLRHAMVRNEPARLLEILSDVRQSQNVQRVEIIGLNGEVAASSDPAMVGMVLPQTDSGCIDCHRIPPDKRPLTAQLAQAPGVLRVSSPIVNGPDCTPCHSSQLDHLGMLLIDISVAGTQSRLLGDLKINLGVSVIATLIVSLGVFGLTHRLVVGRIERFEPALQRFAAGDFAARLPENSAPADELDNLAGAFNTMARNLERLTRENEQRSQVRQQAIAEERERIARELHDGLAQLLGYVNTKVMAVGLLVKNNQSTAAQAQLEQLGEAARALFTDVREAIVGLKLASQTGEGLGVAIQTYVEQFRRLTELDVEVHIDPKTDAVKIPPECELQLIRILQEALSNIRRHASADAVDVDLAMTSGILSLTIKDNGQGFDKNMVPSLEPAHFGLSTMQERAEEIGGHLELTSRPGEGTEVMVTLDTQSQPEES
jgi:signal transduction histidine kinase